MSEPLKIAMVGVTSPKDDALFLSAAYRYLGIKVKEEPRPILDLVGLHLRQSPRDFLAETFKYDVVVLCLIFRGAFDEVPDVYSAIFMLAQPEVYINSPLHSPENWRNRLLGTEAKTIICFEERAEVGYDYMGDLPGYTVFRDNAQHMTIYTKTLHE